MVPHWESSSRPLYVKTVWRDGYHHVVLQNSSEERMLESQNSTHTHATRRSSSQQNSVRNLKTVSDKSDSINLIVPSVKVLLAGLDGFRNINKTRRSSDSTAKYGYKKEFNKAITIDVIPGDSLKYKNINREVSFNNNNSKLQNKALRLSAKSNNDEAITRERSFFGDDNNYEIGDILLSPHFTYANYTDQFNNTLSERVMIWLDLATQNGNYQNDIKQVINSDGRKQRLVTAPNQCPNSQRKTIVSANRCNNRQTTSDNNRDKFNKSENCMSPAKERGNSDELNLDNNVLNGRNISNTLLLPQLNSSCKETNKCEENNKRPSNNNKTDNIKKELHIFMPNLPKKSSECSSSLLSSKCNSSLYKLNNYVR